MSDGRATSPLLVSAALLLLLLLLTPAAEPYGYRRLAKQRFAGLGRHRLSGLGRHAAAVASGLRTGAEQISRGANQEPAFGDFESRLDRSPGRRTELKRLLRHHHHHHKKAMTKSKRLSNRNEICLFKALRRCGNHLITELSTGMDFDQRCSSKEEFLDCMSRMQHGRCHVKHGARHGPSRALVQQYQQRLRRLLQATRGCVIGVDLSTDTD